MTGTRSRRQKAIADLLRAEPLGSHEEVRARLAGLGFTATQATVSRDLEQIGAVKTRRGGALAYALPEQFAEGGRTGARLQSILAEWVRSIEASGNLLVLKTPPGSAHLVGLALDQAQIEEVAGTICGDDTLFVALRNGVNPAAMEDRFRKLAAG